METVTVYFTAADAVTVTAELPQTSGTEDSISPTSSPIVLSSSAVIPSRDVVSNTLVVTTSSDLATSTVVTSTSTSTSTSSTSNDLVTSTSTLISSWLSSSLDSRTVSLPEVKGVTSQTVTSLASVATALQPSTTAWPISTTTDAAAVASTPMASANNTDYHKQAVVGGLAGAMGGTVFLAILLILCCCGRRRWKRRTDNEKQPESQRPPMLANEHSFFRPTPYLAGRNRSSIKSFRTADGNVIRVNLDQFSRPFSEKESWRESVGPRRLTVMNPDKSLPGTPNIAADYIPGFFGRYKGSPEMAVPEQVVYADRGLASKMPGMHIEAGLSKEWIVPSAYQMNKSASVQTSPIVRQQPPHDPFQDDYAYEEDETPRKATETRDWAAVGSALTPFVSRASQNAVERHPHPAMHSVSSFSQATSRRVSSITDPFELESPEVRQEPRFIMQQSPRGGRIRTYDGT
ncbi:hypothetical protein AMS68_004418 [Peltaster fructicola]|uniref:Mid2 domain-containing protein n=1 Tax=Peltaster fructicola TaxID=286661 RepID=A0A6H0XW62_9PEZI|nr:hypothetical protein AMS68_004418 [Peltaster fructicola]